MTTAQKISRHVEALPDNVQQEVLDFIEFMESKANVEWARESRATWPDFSLSSAMRGMEDEDSPYTVADLKESFR